MMEIYYLYVWLILGAQGGGRAAASRSLVSVGERMIKSSAVVLNTAIEHGDSGKHFLCRL